MSQVQQIEAAIGKHTTLTGSLPTLYDSRQFISCEYFILRIQIKFLHIVLNRRSRFIGLIADLSARTPIIGKPALPAKPINRR
jgi:hypothetical protein